MTVTSPIAILGCGYVGSRLAQQLARAGRPILLVRRDDEALRRIIDTLPEGAEVESVAGSIADAVTRIPEGATVVLSSPPSPEGTAQEATVAAALSPSSRLVYLSTTGVFPAVNGDEVDDDYPTSPVSVRGQRRLDVETVLLEKHEDTAILRVPGIYGPGRGVHKRLLTGNYRLIGAADTLVCRIHVDDLIAGILTLADAPSLDAVRYNICDAHPASSREHAMGVAERLSLPEPPTVDPAEVSGEVRAMLGANRRVLCSRLRALGWQPQYPSWREGLEQIIREESL